MGEPILNILPFPGLFWGSYVGKSLVFEKNRRNEAENGQKLSNIGILGQNSRLGGGGINRNSLNFVRFLKKVSAVVAIAAGGLGGFSGFGYFLGVKEKKSHPPSLRYARIAPPATLRVAMRARCAKRCGRGLP